AGPCLGDAVGQPASADGQGRDSRNGDRRTQSHDEGRRNADPEQTLGQRENKNDDRARTRPQANRDNRGKTAPEPMLACQFLRLRRVRVTPGGCVVLMVMIVGMRMAMMMVVPMVVIMRVMMIVVVIVIVIVRVVMMAMVVRMMRLLFPAQQTQEGATFHPQQAQTDQHDQGITDNLDDTDGVAHRLGGCAEKGCGNADNGNGGEWLQNRRWQRPHDTPGAGLVIRDQVGPNDRPSLAWPGGRKNARKEPNA